MDKYAADYGQKPAHMSAYGNAWMDDYQFVGDAKKDDKLYLGVIPAGVRVTGVRLIHQVIGSGVLANLGFEPVEQNTPPASVAIFLNNTGISGGGFKDYFGLPMTFNHPVKLVLTVKGADITTGTVCAVVSGITLGAP